MTDPSHGTATAAYSPNPTRPIAVVVLAAGEGTRMKSGAAEGAARFRRPLAARPRAGRERAARHRTHRVVIGHRRDEVAGHLDRTRPAGDDRRAGASSTAPGTRFGWPWRHCRTTPTGTDRRAARRYAPAATGEPARPAGRAPSQRRHGDAADQRPRRSDRLRPGDPLAASAVERVVEQKDAERGRAGGRGVAAASTPSTDRRCATRWAA